MTTNPSPVLNHALFTAAFKAYDDAIQSLPQFPSDSVRDDLATRIMHLAETGERDPIKLRNYALANVKGCRIPILSPCAPGE